MLQTKKIRLCISTGKSLVPPQKKIELNFEQEDWDG
jgi:hypothetical protein